MIVAYLSVLFRIVYFRDQINLSHAQIGLI